MKYFVFLLSIMLVVSFVGFSSKPSPIYGGVSLILGGGLGCVLVLGFGGVFLGLMMFLVYLGGMLVVFGYTTAMATEEYPEIWVSSAFVMWGLLLGVVMEGVMILYVVGFLGLGEYLGLSEVYVDIESMLGSICKDYNYIREDNVGISFLYGSGSWLLILAGWSLFVSIFIVLEIVRGF
nr:NADH dehydrogenase subunit 6 [Micropotamogale ruwenzorii]